MATFLFGSVGPEGEVVRQEFRWARCRRALPQSRLRALGVPLPRDELEDVVTGLRWEDIKARSALEASQTLPHEQCYRCCCGAAITEVMDGIHPASPGLSYW